VVWSIFVWGLYLALLVLHWRFAQTGRRFAWGAVGGFAFVLLTFWGFSLLSESTILSMPVIVIGLSHHTSPVSVRERFAFAEARIPATLELLRTNGLAEEAVILSTCNRVEIYATTTLAPQLAAKTLRDFLVRCHDYHDPLTDEIYFKPSRKASNTFSKSPVGSIPWCLGNGNPRTDEKGLRAGFAAQLHRHGPE